MKCGNNQQTVRTARIRALSLAALAAVMLHSVPSPAIATEPDPLPTGAINTGSVKTRFLALGTGKSVIIDLPREAKDVLVANPKVANAVIRSAQRAYIIGGDKVINSIVVRGRDQVMLKVNVAEVRRDIVKQMGVDLSASMNYGTAVVNFNNSNPFTAFGRPLVADNGLQGASILKGVPTVSATMRAMESAGVVRTLAEPNLTAISGESATFIAGGEFPIPAGYFCDPKTGICTTQINYKKFGISLNFTPVVLTEGRISLRVMTEVSELSNDNSITLNQNGSSLTIPSIRTRRAETTLEIPSGR